MDCSTALEILESSAPSGRDLDSWELSDAARHVEACTACAATFEDRQLLDRRIGEALWNVPVPPGLKGQLLKAVAGETEQPATAAHASQALDDTPQPAASPVESVSRPTRRRFLAASAGSAVALLLGVLGWQVFFGSAGAQIALEELQADADPRLLAAIANPDGLKPFDGDFDPQVPFEWGHRAMSVDATPQGFILDGGLKRMIAVYEFHYQGRGRPIGGVLLVLPAEWVSNPPAAASFAAAASASVWGTPPRVGNFAPVAWREGKHICVCFVKFDQLDALSRALGGSPA